MGNYASDTGRRDILMKKSRLTDKHFQKWMVELNKFAIEKFGFPVGSLAEVATRPGSIEEQDWYEFYKMRMGPYEALIADSEGA
jgi:hypothetical protein